MKFVLQVIGTFFLGYVFELFLPWYSIAFAAFIMGFILRSKANFIAGFLGIGLLWLFKVWLMDSDTATDLADRVARIFSLSGRMWLYFITMLLGGLVGGFACLTGALLKPKQRSYS
jgi:hypothetical protein